MEVLVLIERAQQGIQSEPEDQRPGDMANVYFYRASVLERLSDFANIDPRMHLANNRTEADRSLEEYRKNLEEFQKMKGAAEYAISTEMSFAAERGNYARAIQLSDEAKSRYPETAKDDVDWYETRLTSQLMANDTKGAAQTADDAKTRANQIAGDYRFQEHAGLMFTAALGQLVTRSDTMEETGREFLGEDHPYVPYIAMMLYTRIASAGTQQEARALLNERWEKADRPHWKQRLQGGDETAWREMLLGMYLDKLKPEEIFDQINDDQSFAKSDLHYLPVLRQELLCEAWFYSALLAESKKDTRARDADLRKVLDTRVVYFIEYQVAKYMISQK
ncbi:MAG: hypothetical protein JOZ83_04345 [Silvibacterium sp.]|nr:hypothetical protein [Silvibacterium sp.]